MNNDDVRTYAAKKKVRLWEIADVLGMCASAFSVKLRYELPIGEKQKIMSAIDNIAEGRK